MLISQALFDCVVEIIQAKAGKADLKPEDLKEPVERSAIQISHFCRIRSIPMALKYTLADMAANAYDMLNPIADDDDFDSRLKSIKQGDTTYELETAKKTVYISMDEIVKAYADDLIPYRGIFWR